MGLERFSDRLIITFLAFACLFFIAFIAFPIAAVFLHLDPDMLIIQLKNPQVLSALTVGIITSSLATITSFIFGIPTAYLLATRRFHGRSIVDTILDIPIVLPPAVAGVALLLAFAPRCP